jgi:hypothetical protein
MFFKHAIYVWFLHMFSTCTQCVLSFVLYMYSMRLVLCSLHVLNASCPLFSTCTQCVLFFCSLHVLNASCSFVLYIYSARLVLALSP